MPDDSRSSASPIADIAEWLRKLFSPRQDASIKEAIEEAIEEVLEEREDEGAQLAPEEETMLRNVLSFGDLTVHDIMIPRPDIVAVEVDITLDELKRHVVEQGHTRIPVYRESLDKVEGFLHIKDIFPVIAGDKPFIIKQLLRPMLFVPPSMKIIDLLVKLRRQASHMAIVVDEYGGTDGLVTLEDVFEEIVGDIQDEHDDVADAPKELTQMEDGGYEADARVRIETLERVLGVSLNSEHEGEEFDTLAGLIVFEFGRVPARGETIAHPSGLTFEVIDADARRVRRVKIVNRES